MEERQLAEGRRIDQYQGSYRSDARLWDASGKVGEAGVAQEDVPAGH